MDIKETFLKLTSETYPNGTESQLDELLPGYLQTDEFGNKFIQIGIDPTCMFTAHLDTATSVKTSVNHVIDGNIIKTDGKSILGADDKAGVTILLSMIENNVKGLYYFFVGEEVGCIGSRKLADKIKNDKIEGITKVISFDRRGFDSVITYQSSSRCCSDNFAQALADELNKNGSTFNYKPDPTGIYTDSAKFTGIYPECTNISVGYRSEHTYTESQDISHLEELSRVCQFVNWESLPIERDPSKVEYRSYYYNNYRYWGGGDDWDDDYGYGYYHKPSEPEKPKEDCMYFMDPDYAHVSGIKMNTLTKKLITVDFCDDRIEQEKMQIIELLDSLDVQWESVKWDGMKLVVVHKNPQGHTTQCGRDDVSDFLPSLDFWKEEIESDYKLVL